MNIQRGEIYLTDLSGYIGSEQSGTRPVIVVQNNCGNIHSPTTVVAPLTSKQKPRLPTHTLLKASDCGINEDSIVLCEQVRVIDKRRLKKRLGQVDQKKIEEIDRSLMVSIGLGLKRNETGTPKSELKVVPFPAPIKPTAKKVDGDEYNEYKSDGKLKARKMESIRSYDDFAAMQNYFLKDGNTRDWAMWTVGVSFGFRISDLLKIKYGWVLNPDKTFRDRLTIIEKKTSKQNDFPLTESIIMALTKYFDSLDWSFDLNDHIFTSQKKCVLTPQSAWRILSDAAKIVIPGITIGSHSLRKSHANIMACLLKSLIDINALTAVQFALNHSDFRTTMRYLGVMDKTLNKGRTLVSDFVLGKSGINELTIGSSTTIDDLMIEIQKITK
jgi:mRNA interferase MazF